MRSSHALCGSRNHGVCPVITTFAAVWKSKVRFFCRTFMSNGCWTETPWPLLASLQLRRHMNRYLQEVHLCRRWRLPYNKYSIMRILEQAVWLPASIRSWIRLMFKFKSPWSWLRNAADLQDPRTRQAPPETSFTLNTWKDASVESVVNQGTTQEPTRKSNWADKRRTQIYSV
jgi:hypothetical protein